MASETSGFDEWLWCAKQASSGQELTAALDVLAQGLERAFGARVWFTEILGKRWSFIAGVIDEMPSVEGTERIELSGQIGLVADSWGCLQPDERTRLVAFFGGLVAFKSACPKGVSTDVSSSDFPVPPEPCAKTNRREPSC